MTQRASPGRPGFRVPQESERLEQLRVPPHSIEAEQAVLGGLMLAPETFVYVGNLSSTDFFRRDHQLIFLAISELAEKGRPFDAVTMGEWFESQGQSELVAGGSYLIELASNTPSAANLPAYVEIVLDKARMRRLIEVGTQIVNDGFSPEGRSGEELLGSALQQLDSVQWKQQRPTGLHAVPLSAFMDTAANTIGYAVHPVVPRNVVTLWGGHGGAGKSMSVLQLMAHGACGEAWQGLAPDGAINCVYISLEDPGDLVRYRLRRICESYSLDPRRVEGRVRVLDCPDRKGSLMTEVNTFGVRTMVATPLLAQIRRECENADLIVVDNASDAYGGNENDRQSVRTFMSALEGIARECGAGLVLLAHIDKSAARNGANGNTYSGSTAWHNSARSRLAIVAGQNPGEVELHHEKNNLGKCADPVVLKWNEHGVLVPLTPMDRKERAVDDCALALAVLEMASRRGQVVPTATTGQSPGHKMVQHLSAYVDAFGKDRWQGARRFHTALDQLQQDGRAVKHFVKTAQRKQIEAWKIVGDDAPNGAPNPAPNAAGFASNPASAPPYRTPYGGSYMGGAGHSAQGSAQSGSGSAQDDDGSDP